MHANPFKEIRVGRARIAHLLTHYVFPFNNCSQAVLSLWSNISPILDSLDIDSGCVLEWLEVLKILAYLSLEIAFKKGLVGVKPGKHSLHVKPYMHDSKMLALLFKALLYRMLDMSSIRNPVMRGVYAMRFCTPESTRKYLRLNQRTFLSLSRLLGLSRLLDLGEERSLFVYLPGSLGYLLSEMNRVAILGLLNLADQLVPLLKGGNPALTYLQQCAQYLRSSGWQLPEPLRRFYLSCLQDDMWYGRLVLRIDGRVVEEIMNLQPRRLEDLALCRSEPCAKDICEIVHPLVPAVMLGILDIEWELDDQLFITISMPISEIT